MGEHDINKEVDCEQQEDEEVCAPPVQDRAIEATIPHPSYDTPPYQHDIGLIRVTRPFDLTVRKTHLHTFIYNFEINNFGCFQQT